MRSSWVFGFPWQLKVSVSPGAPALTRESAPGMNNWDMCSFYVLNTFGHGLLVTTPG